MPEYIERDAVLAKSVAVRGFFSNMISAWDVAHLPAADVEPVRHGRWLPIDEKEDAFDCSECDAMVQKWHNYCPKCGAKMDTQCKPEKEE